MKINQVINKNLKVKSKNVKVRMNRIKVKMREIGTVEDFVVSLD